MEVLSNPQNQHTYEISFCSQGSSPKIEIHFLDVTRIERRGSVSVSGYLLDMVIMFAYLESACLGTSRKENLVFWMS